MDSSPTPLEPCKMFDTTQDDVIYLDLDSGTPCRVKKSSDRKNKNNDILSKTVNQSDHKNVVDMNNYAPTIINSNKEVQSSVDSFPMNHESSFLGNGSHDVSVLPPIESFIPSKQTWLYSGDNSYPENGNGFIGDSNYSESINYMGDSRGYMFERSPIMQDSHCDNLEGSFRHIQRNFCGLNTSRYEKDENLDTISLPQQNTKVGEDTYTSNDSANGYNKSVGEYNSPQNPQQSSKEESGLYIRIQDEQIQITINEDNEAEDLPKKDDSTDTTLTNVIEQTPHSHISMDESDTQVQKEYDEQCSSRVKRAKNVPGCDFNVDKVTSQTLTDLPLKKQSVPQAPKQDQVTKCMDISDGELKTKEPSCPYELIQSDNSPKPKSTTPSIVSTFGKSIPHKLQAPQDKPHMVKTSLAAVMPKIMKKTQRSMKRSSIQSNPSDKHTSDRLPPTDSVFKQGGSQTEKSHGFEQEAATKATYPIQGYQSFSSPLSIKIPDYSQVCPSFSREPPLSLRQYQMRQPILYPHKYPNILRPHLHGTSGGYMTEENGRNNASPQNPFVSEAPMWNIPRPRFFTEPRSRFPRPSAMYSNFPMHPSPFLTGHNRAFSTLSQQPIDINQSYPNGRFESPLNPSPSFLPGVPLFSPYSTTIGHGQIGAKPNREYNLMYGIPNPTSADSFPGYRPTFVPGMWSPLSSNVDDIATFDMETSTSVKKKHSSASKIKGARTRNRNKTYGIKNTKASKTGDHCSAKGVDNMKISKQYLKSTDTQAEIPPSVVPHQKVLKKGSLLRDLLETGSSQIENMASCNDTLIDIEHENVCHEEVKETEDTSYKSGSHDIERTPEGIPEKLKSGNWHPCLGSDNNNIQNQKSEKSKKITCITDVVTKTQEHCPVCPIETSMKDHDEMIGVDSDMDNSDIIIIQETKGISKDDVCHQEKDGLSVKDLVDLCTEEYSRAYFKSNTSTISTATGPTATITTHSGSSVNATQNRSVHENNSVPIFRPYVDSPPRLYQDYITRPSNPTPRLINKFSVLDAQSCTYTPRFLTCNAFPQPSVYDGAVLPVVYGELPRPHPVPRMLFGHFPPLNQSTPLTNIGRGNISPYLSNPHISSINQSTRNLESIQNSLDHGASPISVCFKSNHVSEKKNSKRPASKGSNKILPAPTKEMLDLSSDTINSLLRKKLKTRQKKKAKMIRVNGPDHKDHVFIKPKTTYDSRLPILRPVLYTSSPPCTVLSQISGLPVLSQATHIPMMSPIITSSMLPRNVNMPVMTQTPIMPVLSQMQSLSTTPNMAMLSSMPIMPMMTQVAKTTPDVPYFSGYSNTYQSVQQQISGQPLAQQMPVNPASVRQTFSNVPTLSQSLISQADSSSKKSQLDPSGTDTQVVCTTGPMNGSTIQENCAKSHSDINSQTTVSIVVGTAELPIDKPVDVQTPQDSNHNSKNIIVQIEDTETGSLYELVDPKLSDAKGSGSEALELPTFTQIFAGTKNAKGNLGEEREILEYNTPGSTKQYTPSNDIYFLNKDYEVSEHPHELQPSMYSTSGVTNQKAKYGSQFEEPRLMPKINSNLDVFRPEQNQHSAPFGYNSDLQMAPLYENRDRMSSPVLPFQHYVMQDSMTLHNTSSKNSLSETFPQQINTPSRDDSILWQPWDHQNVKQGPNFSGGLSLYNVAASECIPKRLRKKRPTQDGDILAKLTRDLGITPHPVKKPSSAKPRGSCIGSRKKHHNNRPLPDGAHELLNQWFNAHILNPYPTKDEKIELAKLCGLTHSQVNSWFVNKRNRTHNTRPVRHKAFVYDKLNSVKTRLAKELEAAGGIFQNVDPNSQKKIAEDVSLVKNLISVAETSFSDKDIDLSLSDPLSPLKDVSFEKKDKQ